MLIQIGSVANGHPLTERAEIESSQPLCLCVTYTSVKSPNLASWIPSQVTEGRGVQWGVGVTPYI